MKIEETDYEVLDADDPLWHWRGLQPDLIDRLLSVGLVRAQVGEPMKIKGTSQYVTLFYCDIRERLHQLRGSLSPIATPRPSSGPSTERREPLPAGSPQARQELCRLRVWRQRSSIRRFRPMRNSSSPHASLEGDVGDGRARPGWPIA